MAAALDWVKNKILRRIFFCGVVVGGVVSAGERSFVVVVVAADFGRKWKGKQERGKGRGQAKGGTS